MSLKRILKESEESTSYDILIQYFEEGYKDFTEFNRDLLLEDFLDEFEYDEDDYDIDTLRYLASSYNASFWDVLRDVIGRSGDSVDLFRVIHLNSINDFRDEWGEHWTTDSDMLGESEFLSSINVNHKNKGGLYVLHGEAKTNRCRFPYSGNKEYPEEKELIPTKPWKETFLFLNLYKWKDYVNSYGTLPEPLKKLI